jgi:two-component system, chemotaxis family, protein-glutamate methylesterase/glutaminase
MNVKTKILIVDDSRIFRSAVEESLAGEKDIEVIGSVWNGIKAIEFIRTTRPDLVTLDVEMPDMGGLETLEAIRKFNAADRTLPPVGVIMISSFTRKGADTTIRALESGAFDFITKPEGKSLSESMESLSRQLAVKIRYFASRRVSKKSAGENGPTVISPALSAVSPPPIILHSTFSPKSAPSKIQAVLIGVSTGGPRALAEILPRMCEHLSIPIFIVQHMPPTFTQSLAGSLNGRCSYTVTEAENNTIVREHHAYIAPGGKHMLIRRRGENIVIIVNRQPPEKGCRPSADILFRSAAAVYEENTVAVILTGMGTDGTKGAAALKRAGAYIIAQDEETSVVWGMPGSAQAAGTVDEMLPLGKIADTVISLVNKK